MNRAGRPQLPQSERHERSFRIRLKPDDAALLLALSKKIDVQPAVLLRSMVRRQLPCFAMLQKAGLNLPVEADG